MGNDPNLELILEKLETLKQLPTSLKELVGKKSKWEIIAPFLAIVLSVGLTSYLNWHYSYELLRESFKYDIRKEIAKKKVDAYLELSSAVDNLYAKCQEESVSHEPKRTNVAEACIDVRTKLQKNQLVITTKLHKLIETYIGLPLPGGTKHQSPNEEVKRFRDKIFEEMRKEFELEESVITTYNPDQTPEK